MSLQGDKPMSRTFIQDQDREQVARFVEQHWLAPQIVCGGQVYFPHKEHGIIDRQDGRIVGLITWRIDAEGMHLLTLNSLVAGAGIGTSLILAAIDSARQAGCRRVWLITTNDMMRAISLYQRIGFRIVGVRVGGVDEARKFKPAIPEVGEGGVAIHDEIVMELRLKPYI